MKQSASKKSVSAEKASRVEAPQQQPSNRRLIIVVCALLVMATAAVYFPVGTFGFINFDDQFYVVDNPHVSGGLTSDGFAWAFSTMYFSYWHPLTWLSHMLDCQIHGLNGGAHHLTNLSFHLANTVLTFIVLKRMTGAVWRSAVVAALFALHPLHVESVAWVSERKGLLSAFFSLLAIWAYARFSQIQNGKLKINNYLLALLFFAMALMSKPMAVTLPFVLLLLDYWPLQRFAIRDSPSTVFRIVLEKIPFFALTVVLSLMAFLAQKSLHAVASLEKVTVVGRISNAMVSYLRYVGKMFWPDDLAIFYPHPGAWPLALTVGAGALLLLLSALVVWRAKSDRWLAVGWFWFLGILVPVIGLLQTGEQAMADRYTYLPLIGIFIMIVWGAADLAARFRWPRDILVAVAIVVLAVCGIAAAFQVRTWRDSETLFTHATKVSRGNYLAHLNLGTALMEKGKMSEADANFFEAVRLKPDYAPAHLNVANMRRMQGRTDEAVAHYEESLRLLPSSEQAHYNYGSLLAVQGKFDKAEKHFRSAVRLKPDWAEARFKLGYLLCLLHKWDDGIAEYQAALKLTWTPETQIHLGNAFAGKKDWVQAVSHLRLAVKALPDNASAARDLAWVLVKRDDGQGFDPGEVIRLAQRACELTGSRDASCVDVLSVAYSESLRFDDAIKAAVLAAQLARVEGDTELAAQIQERLNNFRAGRTYREAVAKNNP